LRLTGTWRRLASKLESFGYKADTTATIVLAASSAAVVLWQNARLALLWDAAYILENASRIAAGDVPYRDFPFPYAPLTYYVQALLIRLFGHVYWHHIAYAALACAAATALTFHIVRRFVPFAVGVALTAPLALLGIYCIFPHPFYDPDTCLLLLAILAATLVREDSLLLGAACALPLIAKQNIGLAFTGAAIVLFAVERRWRSLAGVVLGVGAIVAVIAAVFGLGNYVHWTIRYAAERRLPPLASQFAIYNDPALWWWLAVCCVALFVRRARWLIAVPWLWSEWQMFAGDDPLEPEINFLRLWPLVMVLAVICAGRALVRRREKGHGPASGLRTFPLFVVAAIHGAFLSQGTWGSTYGIWPLLVLLLALVWQEVDAPLVPAVVVSLVMLHHAWPYVSENQRLTYAKVTEGPLHHSTLPALRGLAVHGPWLSDFEELVAWSDRHIPRHDAVLAMPGEDLFYYATGRRPLFPVLMFDATVNPYSPREIAALALARDVRWIIVKKRLQSNGDPYPELATTLTLLRPPASIAAELRNYTILRVDPHTRSRPTTE
jgi:hypothetical protein